MIDKKVLLVTLLLVVGAGFVLMSEKKSGNSSKDDLSGELLLESQSIALSAISEVSLSKDSNEISIKKNSDSSWSLANGFPVDATKVASFLEGLEKVKLQRIVTRNNSNFKDFGLESAAVLKLKVQGGKSEGKSVSLRIGSQREKGGQFLALEDQAQAYLASQTVPINVQESYWEYHGLLDTKGDLVRKIDFGAVQITREKADEAFKILGMADDAETTDLNQVAKLLEGVRFQTKYSVDFAPAVEAFNKPKFATIRLFSGKSIKATVGASKSNETEKYFLKLQVVADSLSDQEKWINKAMSENSFEISKAQADKFVKQTSDLVVAKKP